MPVYVYLDSSALYDFGAAFIRLKSLVSEKIVKVYVSEVVHQEVSSHLKSDFIKKIDESEHALRKIIKHQWSKHIENTSILVDAYNTISQAKQDSDKIAEKGVNEFWQSLEVEILLVQPHHGASVLKSYFSGKPPFKKSKNREDFPDSFIYESGKDLQTSLLDSVVHIVATDNMLRDSFSRLERILTYRYLDEFIHSDEVMKLVLQNEIEKRWNNNYQILLKELPNLEDTFVEAIRNISYELSFKEVKHSSIPDDNNEALISVVEEPDEITFMWESIKNYGPSLITIPFEFETSCEIQFSVFRGDVFDLDEEIYVEMGDFETDHYFDASGSVRINVFGTISAQFENEEIKPENIKDLLKEIQFSDIISISILEDEAGHIFI